MLPLYDENYHETTPWCGYAIMLACSLTMLFQFNLNEHGTQSFFDSFACIPDQLFGNHPKGIVPEWATLFTSSFLHADPFHLLGNMLFLWLFGDNIEHAFGRLRFVLFYLISSALTSFGWAVFHHSGTEPLVGASGAISAIMGAYLVLYPKAMVSVAYSFGFFWETSEIRAWVLMALWIITDTLAVGRADGVAHESHLLGFAIGILMGRILRMNMSNYDEIWNGMERIERPIPKNRWERFLQREEEERKYRGF